MQTGVQKLSFGEKLGYSLGDGAANFFFQTIMMYQVAYFTDVLQLGGNQAKTLFLVALFWNGWPTTTILPRYSDWVFQTK